MEAHSETAETPHSAEDEFHQVQAPSAHIRRRGRKKRVLAELAVNDPAAGPSNPRQQRRVPPSSDVPPDVPVPAQQAAPLSSEQKAKLAVPALPRLVPPAVKGIASASALSAALLEASVIAKSEPQEQDPDYLKLASFFFEETTPFHLASLTILAEKLGISRYVLQAKLVRLVSAQHSWSRIQRLLLEQSIASRLTAENLLCYLDYTTFDETPMKASLKLDPSKAPTLDDSVPAMDTAFQSGPSASGVVAPRLDGAVLKFLQSRQRFGMLLQSSIGLIKLFGTFNVPLQILERTTAGVIKQALVENAAVSPWANRFQCKVRASCTDRAPENYLAEQAIVQEREGEWLYCHTDCEVHKTATCFQKTFAALLPDQISGLLHLSLSLQKGSSLTLFRQALRTVIRTRLVILQGAPSPASERHRQACLDLFMRDSSTNFTQRVLLVALPNGNWRNLEQVEYYIAPDSTLNREAIEDMIVHGLNFALCGHKPHIFPNHRWTGADKSVSDLLKLEAIHGILTHAYKIFAAKLDTTQAPATH